MLPSSPHRFFQVLFADDVVTIEYAPGFVPAEAHCRPFVNADVGPPAETAGLAPEGGGLQEARGVGGRGGHARKGGLPEAPRAHLANPITSGQTCPGL
jgi:hypothetical protein